MLLLVMLALAPLLLPLGTKTEASARSTVAAVAFAAMNRPFEFM